MVVPSLPALSPNLFQLILLAELLLRRRRSRTITDFSTFENPQGPPQESRMGIPGMQTFVLENGLLVEHHLRRCTLLIDGLNFENDLYRHYLGHLHAEKEFGGDYAAFSAYIEAFFRALARCQVTPVVIMEGAFEDAKRSVKVERFEQRLDTARAIYAGEDTRGEDINSLLNSYMFEQVRGRSSV